MIQVLASQSIKFSPDYFIAKAGIEKLRKEFCSTFFEQVPTHGDPVPSNFMILADQLMLFDWEYSGLNDPAWDLAFLSCVMDYPEKLDHQLMKFYKGADFEMLYAKMIFFKPIVEFWLGLWGLSQTVAHTSYAEKEFFRYFAISRFRKSQKYQTSEAMKKGLELLHET